MPITSEQLAPIVPPLLDWFRDNARELPWRSDPTPYHVWLSEIMLQQTRVAAVLGYYSRFLEALPRVEDLAAAEEAQLMKLWQGLGYYNRARNLQKAARQVMELHGGQFPADYEQLRALAGVGDYTAGALASIAFGIPVPAVDGNVLRVITRLTADPSPIDRPETKKAVTRALAAMLPTRFPGQFNQALMELGALVCLPNGAPLCESCPLREQCLARAQGATGSIPVKSPKKPRRVESRQVWLITHRGRIALRQRPAKGLLAGLWEYPNLLLPTEEGESWAPDPREGRELGCGTHIFTHIEWHMTGYHLELPHGQLPEGWVWADRQQLRQVYAIPNAFRCFEEAVEQVILESEGSGKS